MLDFVVMGVPRSGTTGLVRGLNLHPEIMCGDEHVSNLGLAGTYTVSGLFEDPQIKRPHAEATRALYLRKKGTARLFGDKNPRYFFYLRQLGRLKKICIYRRRMGFWPSWDARANDLDDEHWARGQVGFFGALELVSLLVELADLRSNGEVLLVDYDSLFFDDPDAIRQVYDYLGAAPNAEALAAFKDTLFASPRIERRQLTEEARQAYLHLRLGELEERVFTRPVVANSRVGGILREYANAAPALAESLIEARVPNMSMEQLAYFEKARKLRNALVKLGVRSVAPRTVGKDKELASRLSNDELRSGRR